MSHAVRVSVDGDSGAVVARNPGIRIVNPNLAVARFADDKDGAHGQNARPAVRGAPAGLLAVELSESNVSQEGIHARVIRYASRQQQPPPSVEVPAQRDLLFTAIGGDGENGHVGSDGQPGRNGDEGERATRTSDATAGTDGGNGGDAGEGTNGADGGDGGQIEIHLNEDNTHLLFAADWDVRGGLGGVSGCHGKPGKGGLGGQGGRGITWEELLGHRYACTSRCIGLGNRSTDTSLVRHSGGVGDGASLPLISSAIRQQLVQGGNLQALIARSAAQYGALRHQANIGAGNCKCAGGREDVSCVGCDPVPVYQTYQRAAALDGRDGRPGRGTTTSLSGGWAGTAGTGKIVVTLRDGTQRNYNSKYDLELVDFDIEDENGDGIFEPGEYAFVRRIRVRNSGGMPSPNCRIPITLSPSAWFERVSGTGAEAFIPPSIEAGEVVTLADSIRVLIRANDIPPPPGTQFFEQDVLSVSAQMPWLNRTLPNFDYSCFINIQYPVALRGVDILASLAQGSTTRFTFEVYNQSSKALGLSTRSTRNVEVMITFDGGFGSLRRDTNEWEDQVTHNVPRIEPLDGSSLSQRIYILPNAQSYEHVDVVIGLYLADPIHNDAAIDTGALENSLIQHVISRVQIAGHHKYDAKSTFLLVTTCESTRPRVQAIQNFVKDDLKMQMDEWNISLYGGLQYEAEDDQDQPLDVITKYRGKSIIFLGGEFEHLGKRDCSIAEFCDARILSEASTDGTCYLFLESSDDKNLEDLLRRLVLPIPMSTAELAARLNQSQKFESRKDLIESIKQGKSFGSSEIQVYALPVEGRWYRLGNANPASEAKKLARHLRQHLPQEIFLIAPGEEIRAPRLDVQPQQATKAEQLRKRLWTKQSKVDQGGLAVLHGNSHEISAIGTEPGFPTQANNLTSTANSLPPFDALMVVQSLPISERIGMLWSSPTTSTASKEAMDCVGFALLIAVNLEIQTFLHNAKWPNRLSFPKGSDASDAFIRIHLPILAKTLQHPQASNPTKPPQQVIEVLQYAEASCHPQKKRQITAATLMPLAQRRTQLLKLLKSTFTSFLHHQSYSEDDIAEFHVDAKSLHSYSDSQTRSTSKVILKHVGAFTKKTEHQYKEGHRTASGVVPRTEYCSTQQWHERLSAIETSRVRIAEETRNARQKLGRMTWDAPREDEGETG